MNTKFRSREYKGDTFAFVIFTIVIVSIFIFPIILAEKQEDDRKVELEKTRMESTIHDPINYIYNCELVRVIDGDTIVVNIDLGLNISTIKTIRMYGINAPEMKYPTKIDAVESKDGLTDLIHGKKLILQTIRDRTDVYGRTLGIIYQDSGQTNVNQLMIEKGYAVEFYL